VGKLRIGDVYRYGRPYAPEPPEIDGLPNFFARVYSPGKTLPTLERGINGLAPVNTATGARRPAVLISSSPHKSGSDWTPWQDTFEPDLGFVRYYGDTKRADVDPTKSQGNAILLQEFQRHCSPDREIRALATPMLLFRRVQKDGRAKGNVQFAGVAVLETASRVTQFSGESKHYFTNYAFELAVLSLTAENEEIDWGWINFRRDNSVSTKVSLDAAPESWQEWVRVGSGAIPRLRRHVARVSIVSTIDQRPTPGSPQEKMLQAIYLFFEGKKARFEGLASAVAAQVLSRAGAVYREGWLTPASADHGTDFVGRLTIGEGFSSTKVVVLGQAKCEKINSPTGGVHVARTVARLRRGWIGVYVTTSYFSDSVQREVLEDQYPIVLVHGLELVRTVDQLMSKAGVSEIGEFLDLINQKYESQISHRRAEEILFD
jgi:hypothetical protein